MKKRKKVYIVKIPFLLLSDGEKIYNLLLWCVVLEKDSYIRNHPSLWNPRVQNQISL